MSVLRRWARTFSAFVYATMMEPAAKQMVAELLVMSGLRHSHAEASARARYLLARAT